MIPAEFSNWTGFVGITVVKATLMLAIAATIALSLRGGSARARAFVWATALVGVLALPLIATVTPAFHVTIPQFGAPEKPLEQIAELPAGESAVEMPVAGESVALVSGSATTDGAMTIRPVREQSQSRANWPLVLAILWGIGAATVCLSVLLGLMRANKLRRGSVPLGATHWQSVLEEARNVTGVGRPLDLRLANVASPMTWGFARPVVVLPLNSATWDDETRRMVLVHELTHIAQNDWLFRLLGRFACALHWFNPVVWYAARQLVAETETACDDAVILCGSKPSRYASELIAIARAERVRSTPFGALAMARRSQLEGRIMSILEKQSTRTTTKRSRSAAVLLAGVIALVATVQPQSRPHEEPEPPKAPVRPAQAEPTPAPVPEPSPPSRLRAPRAVLTSPMTITASPAGTAPRADTRETASGDGFYNYVYTIDDGTSVRVVIKGTVEFNGEATEVIGLGKGSSLKVSVLQDDLERKIVYKRKFNGDIKRDLFVDGERMAIDGDAEDFVHEATQIAAQVAHNRERFQRERELHLQRDLQRERDLRAVRESREQASQLRTNDNLENQLHLLREKLHVLEEELHTLDEEDQRLRLHELQEDVARLSRGSTARREWTFGAQEEMAEDMDRRLKRLSEKSRRLGRLR